ncbi:phage integrase [Enterovibrio nigricans]|uniref:Site-specific recombinase XerD n=1 Tax=Enterovibrio nigricans DSM 22720 TaxID=1121868 RepID=A0A1T4VW28_9GAMM|nr:tyrosine-type recombinase/integrase [Enterovibrio nigricans]SKA69167.1 Site-specific recombinase XerD [Enterovibrio nigricans DSM 22720]
MSIKSVPGGYEVDCRPQGRNGKRYRKRFKTKYEAQQYERWLIATRNNKDWLDKPLDKRRLSELIELWYLHHGQHLKGGRGDKMRLLNLCEDLRDPPAYQVDKALFSKWRAARAQNGIKPSTLNREQAKLSGVFSALIKSEQFIGEHPLKGLSKLKVPSREMGYLNMSEISQLLDALSCDALSVAKLCLSTGARWSEAETLKGSQLLANKVTFVDTKNGKNRTVPISEALAMEIATGKNGRLFSSCYKEFYNALKQQAFDLPIGQASHVLRHSFASHFMMNGGNILTLQKILGHATVLQTMVYAHLSPDYLNEAVRLNPLSTI